MRRLSRRRAEALFFATLVLLLAGVAWATAGDPVRAVAVLVVATPCALAVGAAQINDHADPAWVTDMYAFQDRLKPVLLHAAAEHGQRRKGSIAPGLRARRHRRSRLRRRKASNGRTTSRAMVVSQATLDGRAATDAGHHARRDGDRADRG